MDFLVYSGGREVSDKMIPENFLTDSEVGIFESLRTYGGKIFRLEEHLARFLESARTAGLQNNFKIKTAGRELELALQACRRKFGPGHEFFLRVTLWGKKIVVMAGKRAHPASLYKEGVALQTSAVRRSLSHASPAEAKTTAYQNAILATLEPAGPEIYERVFLDQNGFVTEVRIGNLFIVKENGLLTPPARGILNGVTRRFVIECALQAEIKVTETCLSRHDVFNADEAFLTNTSWEIVPVRELDKRKIGSAIPGPLTSKLHRLFKQNVKRECP